MVNAHNRNKLERTTQISSNSLTCEFHKSIFEVKIILSFSNCQFIMIVFPLISGHYIFKPSVNFVPVLNHICEL